MENKNFAFLIHTHTDCLDVLKICIGQLKKYFPNFKKYVLINSLENSIPYDESINYILYDSNEIYTKRFRKNIKKIFEDKILFLNEEMILYDVQDY